MAYQRPKTWGELHPQPPKPWYQRHQALAFLAVIEGLIGLLALGAWRSNSAIPNSPEANAGGVLMGVAAVGFIAAYWWLVFKLGLWLLWLD